MWKWFCNWWATVPAWAKPPLLVAVLGLLAWLLREVVPRVIRRIYIMILERYDETARQLWNEGGHTISPTNLEIRPEHIFQRMKFWPTWLIKRAHKWSERRKKYG